MELTWVIKAGSRHVDSPDAEALPLRDVRDDTLNPNHIQCHERWSYTNNFHYLFPNIPPDSSYHIICVSR